MVRNYLMLINKLHSLVICCLFISAGYSQEVKTLYSEHRHINEDVYKAYKSKTQKLLVDNGFSTDNFFEKIVVRNQDKEEFKEFLKTELRYDKRELIEKVGENEIRTRSELETFIELKLIKYKILYNEFKAQKVTNRTPISFMPGRAPGQPCQNMDFESQTTNAWIGSYGSATDPTITAGFNNPGNNSGTGQHVIMTGGNDPNVPSIPCVMPGGTASFRLGDNGNGGRIGARISQTFQVQAANPYFTYNYAVVLEDAGHPVAEQPYFRIRMYDGANNLIACATLDIDATNAPGLSTGSGLKYKNWTQVLIPLTAYIGQNVRIEFTTGDCNASGGTHDGYAYIDCSCLSPQILTSSPAICGGSTINVTAPSGLPTYSWTGPGIVGANNTQTITVNQPGTYTVSMTTNTTPPNIPCTFSLDTIIPGNPMNPTAQFISSVVCQGGATVFTDQSTPTGGITNWSWDFDNNGTIDNTVQNPSHIFPAAGSFPVTLTVTSGGCTDNITSNVTVNPGIGPVINPAGPFCSNSAVTTLTSNISGGTWSGAGITNSATGTFDPAQATSGNNIISYTTSGACGGTTTATIVVNPLPASVAGTDVVICTGTPATIGAVQTVGYTYSWSPSTGLSGANISNPSITTVNTGSSPVVTTYTVTTSENTCSNTDVVIVTVNPQPQLVITDPVAVCSPNTIDITAPAVIAGSTSGGTYTYWTDAAGTISIANPTAVSVSGQYYIKNTSTGGCSDIEPVLVTINPLPVSNAGTDVMICSGIAANIGAAAIAGNDYSWLPATGLSAANVSSPAVTTSNNGTTPIVTTYTVTTSVTATGCSNTDEVLVTVNPQPVLVITNPAAVCSPNTVDITTAAVTAGSAGGGTLTYWADAGGTISLATPTAITASGTYYIKVTATGGCTDIDPVVVTINSLPVSNAGTDVTICSGTAAGIGTAAVAGNDYSWLPATGLSASNISNPAITTVNNGTTPIVTTYTVTTSVISTGCSSTDVVTVTIDPYPVLSTTDPASVCSPSTVDITSASITAGTIGTGIFSYFNDAAATSPVASPATISSSGTYYIQLISSAGCSDLDSVMVVINALPVSDAGSDLDICTGSSGPIGGPASIGFTYQWLPVSGLNNAALANPTVTLTNGTLNPTITTYTVTTTNTSTGCQSIDSVVVTTYPVATSNAGSSQSVCSGTSLTLAGAVGGSATGGTWSGGAGIYTPNNSALNAVYTPSAAEFAAGTVTLTLTSDDPTGPCAFASSNVTFFFYQNPVVNFTTINPSGCPVQCASFTDNSTIVAGDAIVSWNWDFGDNSPDSTTQNTSHCYPVTGLYDVTLTAVSNHGCTASSTHIQVVNVYPVPVADFDPSPKDATVLDPEVQLNNTSSSDVTAWTYYFGDGDSIAPNVSSPVHLYSSEGPGIYMATLIVENSYGCRDSITKPIEIGPEFTFFIPNAFTPNGDGVNDFFFGQGIGIKEYDIWIFDRWGNMIYHGDNIDTSLWDGKANNGKDVAQQDVYVWKVNLKDVFDKRHNYTGTVTLVK
jgi:gliding motility-associated-like protein